MNRRRRVVNAVMFTVAAACALAAVGALFLILGVIVWNGISSVTWQFLTQLPKPVGEAGGGIANAIVGSGKIILLAGAIGIPFGVMGAVYITEYGRRSKSAFWIRYSADVLNGVPSIVVGLFVYALVVVPMRKFSALAGALSLSLIIAPLVLRGSEEFLRLVPHTIREAALALGVPRWKTTLFVVLPTAMRGIMTASLLALARAAGETAPLIFTAFGNRFWDRGYLEPMETLPHAIYTAAVSPYAEWHRQAWAAALILVAFVLVTNILVRTALSRGSAAPAS